MGVKVDPKLDSGKWYTLKDQSEHSSVRMLYSYPILSISGWKTFPLASVLKYVNYGHICQYLVESVTKLQNVDRDDLSDEVLKMSILPKP